MKDSSKYREVPLNTFRKDILISGCRVALCNQSAEQYLSGAGAQERG
ncbi:MAG: hypothetical protein L6422_10005 [Candidatus Marinimicrobia bacterium]|nr:hypothetical protein [Candidatus Neomarinimicrobiota bacterium]